MRKLGFYSNQLHPRTLPLTHRLLGLTGKARPRIGYIPSCHDSERQYFQLCQAFYERYSADLDLYFELDQDYVPGNLDALLKCDAIHLSGGDTYYFLHWLKARHLLAPLREYVSRGGVLIGVSAGAILLTPDINSAFLCGDTPPAEQAGVDDYAALGLVDFAFAPHFNAQTDLAPLKAFSRERGIVVYGCPDDAGIAVNGEQVEFFGNVVIIK